LKIGTKVVEKNALKNDSVYQLKITVLKNFGTWKGDKAEAINIKD